MAGHSEFRFRSAVKGYMVLDYLDSAEDERYLPGVGFQATQGLVLFLSA